MKNKRLFWILGGGVLALIFIVFMAVKVLPQTLVSLTKAAPLNKVSLNDSYFIGNAILAKADGVDKCSVNVFVLDKTGKGIKGVKVLLSGLPDDKSEESLSGNDGRASFEIVSTTEGQFTLTASINGVPLDKSVKVTFRN